MSLVITRGFGDDLSERPERVIRVVQFRVKMMPKWRFHAVVKPRIRFRVKMAVREGAPAGD